MRLQSRLVHLRQVHPLESSICENLCNLWENIQQKGSVYSANSVGEYTARRVQSVGGISQQEEIIIKKQDRNMILDIDNILVSSDIITEQFCCDLDACKGICCVEGDAGAPVTLEEIGGIEDALDTVWGDMSAQAQAVVDKQGVAYTDRDGDLVTSIVGGKDCVFTCYEGDCCLCALERAYRAGKTSFIKPISCALYPIREKRFANGTVALNYNRWDVCKDAVKKGRELGLPVYKFLVLFRRVPDRLSSEKGWIRISHHIDAIQIGGIKEIIHQSMMIRMQACRHTVMVRESHTRKAGTKSSLHPNAGQ